MSDADGLRSLIWVYQGKFVANINTGNTETSTSLIDVQYIELALMKRTGDDRVFVVMWELFLKHDLSDIDTNNWS